MNRQQSLSAVCAIAAGLAAIAASLTLAAPAQDAEAPAQPEMKLPPGWTEADMQACMAASTPGEMHGRLASEAGVWQGKTTMWMAPDAEPISGTCTSTVTPILDGRFTRIEMAGETPGMGPYQGMGIYGFDNVTQKFVSTWVDTYGTGIGSGVGELSEDGKTLTWAFTYNCPITKKPAVMREIETFSSPDAKTLEMFGAEPKSGKEYKMMRIELTRATPSASK